eukprot:7385286-Prymnesium_polylepis.1
MRAVAVTARGCRLRWTTRSFVGHVARCGRVYRLFVPPQRAVHQGGEALSIGLRLLGGELQAQLDGFKSRALRGAVQQAPQHLYATEWGVLEVTTAAALMVLLLGERCAALGEAGAAGAVCIAGRVKGVGRRSELVWVRGDDCARGAADEPRSGHGGAIRDHSAVPVVCVLLARLTAPARPAACGSLGCVVPCLPLARRGSTARPGRRPRRARP